MSRELCMFDFSPKSTSSVGRVGRSSSMPLPGSEFKLHEGMSVFCNNELGMSA